MTRAITLRLDEADHAVLAKRAAALRVRPGTLARMLVHAGLEDPSASDGEARAALARLIERSQKRPPGDAVSLVDDARAALNRTA